MNELHLFAGAGGGILGGLLLGHRPLCAVEFDKHARDILIARQRDGILPRFPIWDDVNTFDGKPWRGKVDIVCGGFPCQDISSAGKGKGIEGARSGLWKEMLRIVSEIQPQFVFAENSPLLISRGLALVLCDLAEMGYDARWGVLGASDFGGWHHRKRCWILAYPTKGGRPRLSAKEIDRCGWNIRRLPSQILQSKWNGRKSGFYWQSEPRVGRVVNGVAAGVDKRLARIGNGQIPLVAAAAWEILSHGLTHNQSLEMDGQKTTRHSA